MLKKIVKSVFLFILLTVNIHFVYAGISEMETENIRFVAEVNEVRGRYPTIRLELEIINGSTNDIVFLSNNVDEYFDFNVITESGIKFSVNREFSLPSYDQFSINAGESEIYTRNFDLSEYNDIILGRFF